MEFQHTPVMASEAVKYLQCAPGGVYVDATVGGGGHATDILKAIGPDGRLIGIDRDADAIGAAKALLRPYEERVTLVNDNFRNIKEILFSLGVEAIDGLLLDLGVSAHQLKDPGRGFGFMADSLLDMRMDRTQELSAYDVVNKYPEEALSDIFWRYGEERFSKAIAKAIVRARKEAPIDTTLKLAEIASSVMHRRYPGHSRRHPATRVFQAIRIAVNDELESLEKGLVSGIGALKKGGRVVVISFHSLEDRIVKGTFRGLSSACTCPPRLPKCVCGTVPVLRVITRTPVAPSEAELRANPYARSAKLRAAEKISEA